MRGSVAKGVGVCVVPHPDPPTAARRPVPASRLFRHPRSLVVRRSRVSDPPPSPTQAPPRGENKAKMCDELFKAYKACRKAESAVIVRRIRESRKGMFWD